MAITAPRGTQDFLPEQTAEWQLLEAKIRQICSLYGFGEIRTPMFESTELFLRGIGEYTLSLHDALPMSEERRVGKECKIGRAHV